MRINDPVEFLYLTLMSRWEKTAPQDRHEGNLDGELKRNTQMNRMVYILRKIVGADDSVYRTLCVQSRRDDGESYISKNSSWMKKPCDLGKGWYFEGGTSLTQKQDVLDGLKKVGLSRTFVNCADDFVGGKNIQKYFPTDEELVALVNKCEAKNVELGGGPNRKITKTKWGRIEQIMEGHTVDADFVENPKVTISKLEWEGIKFIIKFIED